MNEINHSERGHSKVGASSSERWMSCPASVQLCETMPNESSPYAAEGTCAHEAAEYALVNETKAPKDLVGLEFEGYTVTEEMAEAVWVYVEFIRANGGEHKEIYIEESFQLSDVDDECFGTNDCCIAEPFGKLQVIDYKHGKGVPVEAKENSQLMYYALGAMQFGEFTEVELVVVQPRCDHPEGPIRRWTTTIERMDEFREELRAAVARTREANPAFGPTDKGCRFCNAKAICPALKKKANEVAKGVFDLPEESSAKLPSVESLTEQEILAALKHASLIEGWLKEVQAYAHKRAEQGHKFSGYKLVKKRANRKWRNESEVIEQFDDLFDEKDLYAPKKLRTPAQLEKVVGKKNVADLTITPDTGTSLVKESDRRAEVKPAIEQAFADEDDLDDL